MRAPSPQHPKRTSFISSRELDPSSWKVFREAGNSNALGTVVWIRSGIVRRFTWMHSCTSTLFLHLPFSFSFAWWILSPLSDWSLLHSHLLTDTPFSDAHPKIMDPMEIRSLTVRSLMGPLSSRSFRTRGHIPFFDLPAIEVHRDGLLAQSRNSSLRAVTCLSRSSPVFPGHPVYSRVPNGQCPGEVLRNSYHGAYRQGIIRGVAPSKWPKCLLYVAINS